MKVLRLMLILQKGDSLNRSHTKKLHNFNFNHDFHQFGPDLYNLNIHSLRIFVRRSRLGELYCM